MAETKRSWLRTQTWGLGTLVGGAVLGLLIGASAGAATMALVADDTGGSGDHPGVGNAFGHEKNADRHGDERDKGEKADRDGHGSEHGKKHRNKHGDKHGDKADKGLGQGHGIEQGMAHGHGPDGDGPPGLVKKG